MRRHDIRRLCLNFYSSAITKTQDIGSRPHGEFSEHTERSWMSNNASGATWSLSKVAVSPSPAPFLHDRKGTTKTC